MIFFLKLTSTFLQFVTSFINHKNEKYFWMKSLIEWIFSILVLVPFNTTLRLIASIWLAVIIYLKQFKKILLCNAGVQVVV